jgi:putative GTP pyrophosphokinase
MSRDNDFLERWAAEKNDYLNFGRYISSRFQEELARIIEPIQTQYFLKTSVDPRVKDDGGLLQKAYYRGKNYQNPYDEITDKVGVRFVVLLGRDIKTAEDALLSIAGLDCTKDRDYELEQSRNPVAFDYAAVHYVVRATRDVAWAGARIPAGIPCEVQIKTLLQHAYSELTHDTIYKPQVQATPEMQRCAAKSMALLEATNDYFEQVADSVAEMINKLSAVTGQMSVIYKDVTGVEPKPTLLEGLLLEGYGEIAVEDYVHQVRQLLDEKRFLSTRVLRGVEHGNPIYQQPSIWLVYLDIAKNGRRAADRWQLTPSELEPLLNDLGQGGA